MNGWISCPWCGERMPTDLLAAHQVADHGILAGPKLPEIVDPREDPYAQAATATAYERRIYGE